MLEARKSRTFDRLYHSYQQGWLLPRHFHYVGMSGSLDAEHEGGVLYVMNHSSWWDGLLAYEAFRARSEGDHYVMMAEEQLKQFPFFCRLGAYSIDKTTPQTMIASLRYTSRLLQEGKRVWMFPQGDIYHLEERPLVLKEGAAHVLRQCPEAIVIPVTAYYSLYHHQKAEATLMSGEPLIANWGELGKAAITQRLAAALEQQLERHKAAVISCGPDGNEAFERLAKPGGSTSEAFRTFRRRASAWKSFFGR